MPQPNGSTRACKYRRISDDHEGLALGVARQDEDLDAYAAQRGYLVVADRSDNDLGASTRSRKPRPGFDAMLADARAGRFEVIIAYTSGRLTRRPRENEDLIELAERHGIRFEYIRSPSFDLNTADGRLIARMLAAQDAAESERIGERVSRQIQQRLANGGRHGMIPFGYRSEREAVLIREAYASILAGGSLRGIAHHWNGVGALTPHGNRWVAQTVSQVLRNERNRALVGDDTWHAARAILSDPSRRTSPGGATRYLLSGIATCGVPGCGAPVRSGATKVGTRSIKCSRTRHLERKAEPIEDHVIGVVLARLGHPGFAELFEAAAPDLGPARARAAELRAQREALAADLTVELDFAAARDRRLREELAKVESELAAGSAGSVLAPFATGREPAEAWLDLDLDQCRAVIRELVEVVVLPVGRGMRPFDPASVRVTPRR